MNPSVDIDNNHIWHPYNSVLASITCHHVRKAEGVYLELENGVRLIDGMSSWWTAIHGYNHPVLNHAIEKQLKSMAHCHVRWSRSSACC